MGDQEGVDSAINKLNGVEIDGQEVKVEQARPREEGRGGGRSFGDRGRRGGFGDRGRSGGFGDSRRDDRRDDRRGGGGCFNCNQSGHMARDCPEEDRRRGGGGGGFGRREAVVVVAELATTATKTDIWQENVPKKTAEIVEDDRLYLTGSFKKPTGMEYLKD